MTKIRTVQNDSGYSLQFTLQNNDGTAFDLTGNSKVEFLVQYGTAAALNVAGAMTVTGAATLGVVNYIVGAGVFDAAGEYNGAIRVTFASGRVVTFPDIDILVSPALPVTP